MRVIVAESAGFCFGVQRAVLICEKAAVEHKKCVTLGPIIHNQYVIDYLEEKGVKAVSDISEITPGTTVVIRSHGAGKKEYEALEAIGANIIDATCPDVRRIHDIVRKESESCRLLVIIGDPGHPEVVAISGWCGSFEVFETPEELLEWLRDGENSQKPISFVFQTTNRRNSYYAFVEIIKKECTNLKIFDTICNATCRRQQEAVELSKVADIMVVVGGKNSGNSLSLTSICKEYCRSVFFIENVKELDGADISESDTIGITAGASTPAWIIKEVTQKMSDEVMLDETCAETEIHAPTSTSDENTKDERLISEETLPGIQGEAQPETVNNDLLAIKDDDAEATVDKSEPVIQGESRSENAEFVLQQGEQQEPIASLYDGSTEETSTFPETFEEMLEKSIKTLHTGQKVAGVVTSITATEVSVDLGTKQSGYIPISEFTDDPAASIDDIIKIGDTIESFVMRVNDVEGMVMLSKKRLDAIKNWDEIEAAKDSRAIVEGIVSEENKGGVVVNVKGVRVFVPASQTGLPKSAPMSDIVKKTVRLRVTEVNQSRRRVVGSIRAVQAEERREKSDRLWEEIENGKQYDGIVKSMTSYGVFVDIGGVDGMIHISELSWTRIKQPSEVMAIGDEVSVYVLSFDKENRKISLGYKKNEDNPWTKFTTQYSVGDIINVKIVKMMPFGAFAEICPGVDGLIHISQITDHRIGLPSEILSDGQMVDVKITEIDFDRKKVSLSIRALIDTSSQPVSEREAAEAAAAGKAPVIVYDTDSPPVDNEHSEFSTTGFEAAETQIAVEQSSATEEEQPPEVSEMSK